MVLKMTSADNRVSIVKPVLSSPRLDQLWIADGPHDFLQYVADIPKDEMAIAIDFETRGTVHASPNFRVVGVGLSCSIGSIYLDMSNMEDQMIHDTLIPIISLPLIAYNTYFDAACMQHYGHSFWDVNWIGCAYVLYKQLACEGFPGQQHGLKLAEREMLGWEESNDIAIDEWLVANGYITDQSKLTTLDTPEKRMERFNSRDKNGHRKLHPSKGEMWRVPAETLGKYCALDSDACWQLWTMVLVPALITIPPMNWDMHQEGFLPLIGILIDNHFSGITIDAEKLSHYNEELILKIAKLKLSFREEPLVAKLIQEREELWIKEIAIPAEFKKDGKPSKNYQNYVEKLERIKSGLDEKLNKEFRFNINGNEMRELLYSIVQYEVVKQHEGADSIGKIRITGGPEGTHVGAELEMTDSGQLPMDGSAFQQMGSMGELLNTLSEAEKLQTYVQSGLLKADECGDGRAHPQYRVHGTLTGRLAGGGGGDTDGVKVNYQQLPGDHEYLSCYIAREGYVLVQADYSSVEPTVLAEMSKDPMYMELYGTEGLFHDVYTFIGTRIKYFKEKILAAGYDPTNPDNVENMKKVCKAERKILKVVMLSSGYGAGVYKIWTTLKLQGVDITQQDVQQIYDDYWGPDLFGGIRSFQSQLEREWRENKGWCLDALGCSVPVAEKLKRDLMNRCCQRSGHSILMLFLGQFLRPGLVAAGIDFNWYIPDLHDETIYEVRSEQALHALDIHRAAVDSLNQMLGGVTTIKMEPKLMRSLAERKDD